jgi:hypothetical protein
MSLSVLSLTGRPRSEVAAVGAANWTAFFHVHALCGSDLELEFRLV